ncbi:hypothetical protein F3J23_20665 [Chryseobacterium sp. Tr-659]|uniref:hypothetical protein n=1 Tax=Chryseobacterium sp. Tr-659 TaxID=2608340 RepID=UPI00142465CD|nr:hypothetical protein [Chryseobacterium sp. Tr-659]NIF07846.1 hypothetical protein [Chryseobacterium sp. Tr-659]
MKNRVLFSIVLFSILSFFTSCASLQKDKEKEIFVKQFVSNNGILNSLESFYNEKTITIYDENKVLVTDTKTFDTSPRTVNMVILKPQNNKYLSIKNFVLNQNLACLTFLTADREEGFVFYLRRKDNKNEWQISNMFRQHTR